MNPPSISNKQSTGRGKKRATRTSSVQQKLSPAVIAELNRLVTRQVAKTEEVKEAYYYTSGFVGSYNYTGFGSNQIMMLTPYASRLSIVQGLGQGDRIGNQISVKRAHIKFYLNYNHYDSGYNPNPQPVHFLWFLYKKRLDLIEGSSLPNFFQLGDSTQVPQGSAPDLLYDVNSDRYVLLRKGVVKLGYSAYTTGTGSLANYGYFSNNDYALSAVLDIPIGQYMKKKLTFNDTTNSVTDDTLSIAFWTVNSDGTAVATTNAPLSFWFLEQLYFTDS